MDVPFYLNPSPAVPQSIFETSPAQSYLDVTTNYQYQNKATGETEYEVMGFFQDALDSSLDTIGGGISNVLGFAKEQYVGLTDELGNTIDNALWRGAKVIGFLIIGLVVILWIAGKSGLISGATSVGVAFLGGK